MPAKRSSGVGIRPDRFADASHLIATRPWRSRFASPWLVQLSRVEQPCEILSG